MSVKTYSLKKDGEKQLSENFKVKEFRCKDGTDKILVSPETVKILQSVRDYFGKIVHINSAYRTPAYNKKVGGASASQHVKGTACDIRVDGVPPEAVAAYLEAKFPISGIGLYNRTSHFVHIDTRGRKVFWVNKGNNVVSSFNQGKKYEQYKAKQENTNVIAQKDVNGLIKNYFAEIAKKDGSDWSEEAREWAKEIGLFKGDQNGDMHWKSSVTREEVAVLMKRMVDLIFMIQT